MVLKSPLFRRFEIDDRSMLPGLPPGTWVLSRRLLRPPEPGAIVFLPPSTDNDQRTAWVAKRVVAQNGDRVIAGEWLLINGTPLLGVKPWSGSQQPDITISEGHVYVLSDAHQLTLADSRRWGPVRWEGGYRLWFRYGHARTTTTGPDPDPPSLNLPEEAHLGAPSVGETKLR